MRAIILGLGLLLMASVAHAQPANDPLWRTLTWFNYLAGDDIREACAAEGPDRYRFVYNGLYHQQVRAYDFDEYPGVLNAFVVTPAPLSEYLSQIVPQFGQAGRSSAQMTADQRDVLLSGLQAAGFSAPPPVGIWLESNHFYWVVTACIGGHFQFNAWAGRNPAEQQALGQLGFVEPLLALDSTEVPMNWPGSSMAPHVDDLDETFSFRVQVGHEGLRIGRYWRQ